MKELMKIILKKIFHYAYLLYLKRRRIRIGVGCTFNGWGHIYNNGTICFGERVQINSGMKYNPIGGSTKNIIRVYSEATLKIGNDVGISNSAIVVSKRITIGNNVLIGGNCKLYDSDFHSLDMQERRKNDNSSAKTKEIRIDDDVFIGAHCIISKGAQIGKGSVIGAGSVVTGDVPAGEIWAGNPARFIRKVKLDENTLDYECRS